MVKEEIAASLEGEFDMFSISEEDVARLVAQRMREMGEDEIQARVERLTTLRAQHCVRSQEQEEVLARDTQRTIDRRIRLKELEAETQAA
jgi:hypothetical protein